MEWKMSHHSDYILNEAPQYSKSYKNDISNDSSSCETPKMLSINCIQVIQKLQNNEHTHMFFSVIATKELAREDTPSDPIAAPCICSN